MSDYLDHALVGKTIKSAQQNEQEIVVIHFTDGSYLEIYVDDMQELVVQLCTEVDHE